MPVLQYYVVFIRTEIEDKQDAKATRVTKIPPSLSIYEKTDSLPVMRAGRKCLRVNIWESIGRILSGYRGAVPCVLLYMVTLRGSLLRSVWVYSIH